MDDNYNNIQIRRLEVELQYARDILTSTKQRYEDEIAAIENSYKFVKFVYLKQNIFY